MRSWPAELPPVGVDPDDARRAAEEILARPEFAEPQPSIVDRVLDAVGDFLGDAVSGIGGSGPGDVISLVVVLALLGVAGWFLWRSLGAGWVRATAPEVTVTVASAAAVDPETWFAEADALAARGERRGALRCRYQGLVASLIRRGVVDDVAGRTPRELAALVSPTLDEITERFEGVWYGGQAVDTAEWDRFRGAVDGALDAVRPVARV